MNTKPFKWRTVSNSYVYVDSDTGSDVYGNGTMASPYQTLGKAWRGHTSVPSTIICRGRFTEDMADGNHSAAINGDYYGAAVFDGCEDFIIYGFTHNKMIIKNCPIPTADLLVHTGSVSLAGAGRALTAAAVGSGHNVYGVVGSPTSLINTPLYFGCIGGTSAVSYQVVASPKAHINQKIWFGGNGNPFLEHMTVYDVPYDIRRKGQNGNNFPTYVQSIFGKVAFYGDEPIKFKETLFTSDCEWYYNDNLIEITGETSEERQESLLQQFENLNIAASKRPVFEDCVFSVQTSEDIWNNPERWDFTLKDNTDATPTKREYYGALPPSINVPIMNDSTGIPGTWDERTASGILSIVDDTICLNDASGDKRGEIYSKVLKLDTDLIWISGIFAHYSSQFADRFMALCDKDIVGDSYHVGDTLEQGLYYSNCPVVIRSGEETFNYSKDVIVKALDGDIFESGDESYNPVPTLTMLKDSNISNVCYVRSTSVIYKHIKANEGLQSGATYFNYGSKDIVYRGRSIVPMESFIAENDTDTFECIDDADYTIGVMFDDSRVPVQMWIPAQMFGEYFVDKHRGVIICDEDGVPLSSGNYISYLTSANGGYKGDVHKVVMNEAYCQFKISAVKI